MVESMETSGIDQTEMMDFVEKLMQRQLREGRIFDLPPLQSHCLMLRHTSTARMVWDCILFLALGYLCFNLPLTLAFGSGRLSGHADQMLTVFFAMDLVLNF